MLQNSIFSFFSVSWWHGVCTKLRLQNYKGEILRTTKLVHIFYDTVNRDEKSQLLVGVRRANRQQTTLPSSVLSADSMHIGVLAAAAHAAANQSPFTIFYNPRFIYI